MAIDRNISSIRVPNDPAYIDGVLRYTEFIAKRAGLTDSECSELCVALGEACMNVVTHAFGPEDEETYTVQFENLIGGVKVVIEEMGLPFTFNKESSEAEAPGLHAIKNNVDRMVFINRGKKGKKLILCKYTSGRHVSELFSATELKSYESCALAPEERGKVEYDIHLMKPEEAGEVSRCIYMAYRYSYLKEDLYFPERIVRMNASARMISAVATVKRDGGGTTVIAHFALLPADNREVAEIGVAVTVPKYRGLGIMKAMLAFLIEHARAHSFKALYGNAYSMHRLSQKTNLKFGFHETAIQLGRFPPSAISTMTEMGLKGAGHVITSFKFLTHGSPLRVYVPMLHKAMITDIYKELGANRIVEDSVPEGTEPMVEESALKLTILTSHQIATITVEAIGRDLGARIDVKRVELEDQGINAIYVDFQLRDPHTPSAVSEVESHGFCFSGLLPNFSDGDVLRLQRYFTPVEYDELETESEFALKLKEYIRGLDPRYRVLHR